MKTLRHRIIATLSGTPIPVTTPALVLLVKRCGERNAKGKVWNVLVRMEREGAVRRLPGYRDRVPHWRGGDRLMWCNAWLLCGDHAHDTR